MSMTDEEIQAMIQQAVDAAVGKREEPIFNRADNPFIANLPNDVAALAARVKDLESLVDDQPDEAFEVIPFDDGAPNFVPQFKIVHSPGSRVYSIRGVVHSVNFDMMEYGVWNNGVNDPEIITANGTAAASDTTYFYFEISYDVTDGGGSLALPTDHSIILATGVTGITATLTAPVSTVNQISYSGTSKLRVYVGYVTTDADEITDSGSYLEGSFFDMISGSLFYTP
jgi:hypothetical protein